MLSVIRDRGWKDYNLELKGGTINFIRCKEGTIFIISYLKKKKKEKFLRKFARKEIVNSFVKQHRLRYKSSPPPPLTFFNYRLLKFFLRFVISLEGSFSGICRFIRGPSRSRGLCTRKSNSSAAAGVSSKFHHWFYISVPEL